jgi:hypothetical protein
MGIKINYYICSVEKTLCLFFGKKKEYRWRSRFYRCLKLIQFGGISLRIGNMCQSVFSREPETIGGRSTHLSLYLSREVYLLWELAHSIMEAEKSDNLPSASWRTRKASGVTFSKSE